MSERPQDGNTVLHYCAIYNDEEVAELLINCGADIDTRENQLRSPLQLALASESTKVSALLIARNCSLSGTVTISLDMAKRPDELSNTSDLLKSLAVRLNEALYGPFLLQQAIGRNDTQVLGLSCEAGFDANSKAGSASHLRHYV